MDARAPKEWKPLTSMPDGARSWAMPGYGDLEAEWRTATAGYRGWSWRGPT